MKTPLVPWTRAFNTDAVNNAPCPRCKATPGQNCRLPSGRRYFDVHLERTDEFDRLYPEYRQQGVNKLQGAGKMGLDAFLKMIGAK